MKASTGYFKKSEDKTTLLVGVGLQDTDYNSKEEQIKFQQDNFEVLSKCKYKCLLCTYNKEWKHSPICRYNNNKGVGIGSFFSIGLSAILRLNFGSPKVTQC